MDCDGFTREYYQKNYGIEEFIPIGKPIENESNNIIEYSLPPFNGWGSLEDSAANCISIQPKAPHRDMNKFLKLDRCNLRFKAQMISNVAENSQRTFIITFHLNDDTISVFEVADRNSGFCVCQCSNFGEIDFLSIFFRFSYYLEWRFLQTIEILFTESRFLYN